MEDEEEEGAQEEKVKRIRWRKARRKRKIRFNSENFLKQTIVRPLKK
jgi:hypothetical protein